MQMFALSALVYATTGSPLLAALAFLGGLLPQAVGALTLLSLADRVPPRGFPAGWHAVKAAVVVLFATGVLPVWATLLLIMVFGAFDALSGGIRACLTCGQMPHPDSPA